ncbi:hypothetical protein [Candidatus Protochlamydia phocaeensis]|uniref:hypothetical protein n=1 Tax=Candidatus Protochlamydia phocaeensis TaxID=1414722 RepID=UPI0012AC3676|nr:hypothetical protein [Candidatus Protochlamydia phocaeensis]
MKDSNFNAHIQLKKDLPTEQPAEASSNRLGAFFNLLLQIDKRNHSERYEHYKSGASPD